MDELTINGEVYVKKSQVSNKSETLDGLEYKMVRTYSAGVFAGYLESEETKEGTTICVLRNARRIWSWTGAASLSELSTKGTSNPKECKFPAPVDRVKLTQVIEILDITNEAKKSIDGVKIWTNH